VQPGEQMDEEVARHGGAVVLIIAPAEQADGLERPLRGVRDEAVPIDVGGEASGAMEYCHAPRAVLRSSQLSTRFSSPMAPCLSSWRILANEVAEAYCEPTMKMRDGFLREASITWWPSATVCTMGFSQ
jgi:hypothetical protein